MHNLFDKTHYVVIETHNRCNYAYKHKRCPASLVKGVITLGTSVVKGIIDTLAKYEYAGSISFYLYNDSLLEPRLSQFINYAKEKCPKSTTIIGTNGWLLSTRLAIDLYAAGLDFIIANGYSAPEYNRLISIRLELERLYKARHIEKPIAFLAGRGKKLDIRLEINKREKTQEGKLCYAPLTEVLVRADGEMPLCCIDSANKHSCGNIHKESFEDIVSRAYPDRQALLNELVDGVRTLDFCKRCFFEGRWGTAYKDGADLRHKRHAII